MPKGLDAKAAFAWIGRHAASLAGQRPDAWRAFAIAVLIVQAALCIAAALTHVMLHGDGAYFVFVIGAGDPWRLKWADISVRAATYILTVAPTEHLTHALHLSPMQTASVNGLIFYGVPVLQFAVACAMVWRTQPAALMFPVANYVFATLLGYGFPSEILLAPGFLWIALFALFKSNRWMWIFFAGLTALTFSHELALPAVLIVAFVGHAHFKRGGANGLAWFTLIYAAGLVATLFYLRSSGGGAGSDSNAIYVFDPRRVLANPTLWFALLAGAVAFFAARRTSGLRGVAAFCAGAVLLVFILHALAPGIDFEDGRYDSARTLIGGAMAALAFIFAGWLAQGAQHTAAPWSAPARSAIAAFFAVGVASALVFLMDWNAALGAQARLATPSGAEAPAIITRADARALITPNEAANIEHMGYFWALPYRAMVLADGASPGRLLIEAPGHPYFCARASAAAPGIYPPEAMAVLERNACAAPPPQGDSLLRRIERSIRNLFGQGP